MYSEPAYGADPRWGPHMEPPLTASPTHSPSPTGAQGQETVVIGPVPEPSVPQLEPYIVYENEEPIEIQASASADFAAGLLGGCAGLVFGHPFDTIKVRQQTNTQAKLTLVKCIRSTMATEGVRGFFRGMAFPLAAVGLQNAVFFGVYGNALRALSSDEGAPSYKAICVAGGLAGAVQGIIACPIDLVKIQLQAQTDGKPLPGRRLFKGPMDCISHVYKQHGFRACFRGIEATIFREVPGFAIYISSYQYMCDLAASEIGGTPGVPYLLLAGGLAGMISWMINCPIDIIKSRIQADNPVKPRYQGIRDCAIKSYQAEGWRVFWRGLPVSLCRAFPTNAVTFAVYSTSLQALQDYAARRQEQKLNSSR